MKILAIETSCDETSIAVVDALGEAAAPQVAVLGHALYSQVPTHAPYGGVFPMLAKREHARNFAPLLASALAQAAMIEESGSAIAIDEMQVRALLEREPEAAEMLVDFLKTHKRPAIDAIAVTRGPGLEPALWVGIQCAEALARAWQMPLYGINHMEGHIFSAWAGQQEPPQFPLIALLVSGGHTEIVKSNTPGHYTLLGETRDDAAGEAFDKIARVLDLPYPGGPEISRLAREAREEDTPKVFDFPRPMMREANFDFSFSGLKTHVLYAIRKIIEERPITEDEKKDAAREAENAICEVLAAKTRRAVEAYPDTQSIVVAGGVAANNELRERMLALGETLGLPVFFPSRELSTDNAIMIGIVAYVRAKLGDAGRDPETFLKAEGRLALQ